MISSKTTTLRLFDQEEYQGYAFYYCDNHHPFIAYTTCFCPLCVSIEEVNNMGKNLDEQGASAEKLENTYWELVEKVMKVNPELLL